MVMNALKLFSAAAFLLLLTGAWPNRRFGAVIAIGLCTAAAVVLHYAAP
jgi:hypothetical protein